jgi:hypothetical protein
MKKLLLPGILYLFLCFYSIIQAGAQDPINITYPFNWTGGGFITVEEHPAGGYMALGWSNTWDKGPKIYLTRISAKGDTLGSRKYSSLKMATRWAVDMAISKNSDSYYILTGSAMDANGGRSYNSVMKVNLASDSLWQIDITGIAEWSKAHMKDIQSTLDGGCIASSGSYNSGQITKLSKDGVIEWNYSPAIGSNWQNVAQAPDNNYFATGNFTAYEWKADRYGYWSAGLSVAKISPTGNKVWEKNFFTGYNDAGDSIRSVGNDVLPMDDGGCLVTGYLSAPKWKAAFLMRLDKDGNSLWMKKYYNDPTQQAQAYRIVKAGDNFLVHMIQNTGFTTALATLNKINQQGEIIWSQHGYNYWIYMNKQQANGDILWSGGRDASGFFVRTTPDGMFLPPALRQPWDNSLDVSAPSTLNWWRADQQAYKYQVQLSEDKNFTNPTVYSYTVNEGENADPYYLYNVEISSLKSKISYYWRVRSQGVEGGYGVWSSPQTFTSTIKTGINDVGLSELGLIVYPNPASSAINVSFVLKKAYAVSFSVYNSAGQLVLLKNIETLKPGKNEINVNVSHLQNGIYMCILNDGLTATSKKLLINR